VSVTDEARTLVIEVPEGRVVLSPLFGAQDVHRKVIERRLKVRISARDERLVIQGPADRLAFAQRAIDELIAVVRAGGPLFLQDIEQALGLLEADGTVKLADLRGRTVLMTHDRRAITPKTPNQRLYLEAMKANDLVFAVGPAGTGKTYLAMAAAVHALREREVERIILTRPAVEAGERLGFLPGSLTEKVNPYLQPLYDALFDMLGIDQAGRLIEAGGVEVAPLAFMRGRTLNRAFVILDEAQNTTRDQMKMFLTRLGHDARAVVTGDVTQVDLPAGKESGLAHASRVLAQVEGIGHVRLTPVDVVRHPLVQAIVRAYDRDDAQEQARVGRGEQAHEEPGRGEPGRGRGEGRR
jgi:phosphate starvation-inducible PhoH-like protein